MVLVVDDELMNIEVMTAMLDELNFAFEIALRGSMALSCIQKRIQQIRNGEAIDMYKIVFLDYSMPDMDGPKVATEIRNMINANFNKSNHIR